MFLAEKASMIVRALAVLLFQKEKDGIVLLYKRLTGSGNYK
jgi:hypothetical protein